MNYFFKFTPHTQVPDSTTSNALFMQNDETIFSGKPSIMSFEFTDKSIDSLVEIKTRIRRIRKKKVVKSYKYLDSYLIIKDNHFYCLTNAQKPAIKIIDFDNYILKTNINSHKTIKKTFTIHQNIKSTPKKIVKKPTPVIVSKPKDTLSQTTESAKPLLSGEIWLMGLILGTLLFFTFIKVQFNSKLKIYFKALFSYQFFNKIYREQNSINQKVGLLLSLLFYSNISLLFYYTFFYSSPIQIHSYGFSVYIYIVLFLFLLFLSFNIINKILSVIFEIHDLLNEYLYSLYYFHRMLGLVLLPFVVLYPYLPSIIAQPSLYLAWGFLLLAFILRWFRGLQISFKNRVPFLYMILYLCTLEIIPLMFITKMILSLY